MKLQAPYQPQSIIPTLMLILITATTTITTFLKVIQASTVTAVIVSVAEAMKETVEELIHLFE